MDEVKKVVKDSNLAKKLEVSPIETGLKRPTLSLAPSSERANTDPLDELFHKKPIRQHVKEFGQVLGLVGLLIALYIGWRQGSVADVGAVTFVSLLFIGLCAAFPRLMLPVFQVWMKFAGLLEIVMTRVILGAMWSLMFIPISLLLRILRIRVMDMTYRANVPTYWLDVPPAKADFLRLEKQF